MSVVWWLLCLALLVIVLPFMQLRAIAVVGIVILLFVYRDELRRAD